MLFDTTHIGGLELKNWFVRSATYDGGADKNGHVTVWQTKLYERLAKGGAGLIITGLFSVHPSGRISGYQNTIDKDTVVVGLRSLVKSVQRHGTKIAAQIAHCGREAHLYQAYKGKTAVAPSVVASDPYFSHPYRALDHEEIESIIDAYGQAAYRAQIAGFDAVQVHGAHAYLVSQFLSPYTNRRKDVWGGSFERRFRFLEKVYKAIRVRVGENYPVLIKLGVADGFAGGLTFEDGKKVAQYCQELGFDAIEISQGLRGRYYGETEFRTKVTKPEREAYFRHWTHDIRREATVPIILVGGLRSYEIAEELVADGQADLLAMSRPLIREPGLILRWRNGDRQPGRCVSCNRCFELLLKGRRLKCAVKTGDHSPGLMGRTSDLQ